MIQSSSAEVYERKETITHKTTIAGNIEILNSASTISVVSLGHPFFLAMASSTLKNNGKIINPPPNTERKKAIGLSRGPSPNESGEVSPRVLPKKTILGTTNAAHIVRIVTSMLFFIFAEQYVFVAHLTEISVRYFVSKKPLFPSYCKEFSRKSFVYQGMARVAHGVLYGNL